jgi:AcrR family transcriptional regulator
MSNEQPQKKPTSYHHGDLKNALIEEALRMVEEEGVESISLRDITKRVGTSRSAIYRHFDSKEALMREVVMAGFARLAAHLEPALTREGLSTIERFRTMAERYMEFARSYPALYRMIFGERAMQAREAVHDIHDPMQETGFHALKSLVERAQREGLIKKEDPMLIATVIWATMHGQAILLIDGHLHMRENFDAVFEMAFNTLLEGLSTTSAKVRKVAGLL